jgi:hypothetical protein
MAESKTPKKTTKRTSKKTASKKSEAITEAVEQIQETPVIDEVANENLAEVIPEEAPVKKTSKKTVSVKLGTVIPEEGLKIRRGPGVKCEKIGKLAKDETVEILEENGDFVRIGHNQWVMKSFLGGI